MAKRTRFDKLLGTVTKDVLGHSRDLTRHYVEQEGVSRVTANNYIQRLEAEGWIARSGPVTHPVFSPGYKRHVRGLFSLKQLEEDVVWRESFQPFFSLAPNIQNITSIGFTEIVNNAIDHSEGSWVFVAITQDEKALTLSISDDGVGVFAKIATALHLPDMRQALFELAKGKLTTDPANHSGEGVFFTSRMFDSFSIIANELRFNHNDLRKQDLLEDAREIESSGTYVYMQISLTSARTANEIYAQFTDSPEDYGFSKTIVPMRLARYGDERLLSRSQAKRLIARFDRFKTVVLDFADIHEIGQAFADELFRVYGNAHSEVDLVPTNMSNQVERMWLRVMSPQMGKVL